MGWKSANTPCLSAAPGMQNTLAESRVLSCPAAHPTGEEVGHCWGTQQAHPSSAGAAFDLCQPLTINISGWPLTNPRWDLKPTGNATAKISDGERGPAARQAVHGETGTSDSPRASFP